VVTASEGQGASRSARGLFRDEVVRSRADRLTGTVTIGMPLSWHFVGGFLFVAIVAGIILLAATPYAEVETVPATLLPDHGMANIMSTRSGVVTAVNVVDGSRVRPGQPLITIRNEEAMTDGSTSSARTADAIRLQRLQIAAQVREANARARAEEVQNLAGVQGLVVEIAYLDQQLDTQRQLVDSAAADIARVQKIANGGFISVRDMQARRDVLLSRRQQLAQLEQARAAKITDLGRARQSAVQAASSDRAQLAQLEVGALDLDTKLATSQALSAYVLDAPIAGVATAIAVRPGDHVTAEQQLATIVPARYNFEAEFYVPTSRAGGIYVGQEVRLSVDAFPYERYGSLNGAIREISSVPLANGQNNPAPAYRVRATLSARDMNAFSQAGALRPGMAMTARIVARRESLLRWLVFPPTRIRGK